MLQPRRKMTGAGQEPAVESRRSTAVPELLYPESTPRRAAKWHFPETGPPASDFWAAGVKVNAILYGPRKGTEPLEPL